MSQTFYVHRDLLVKRDGIRPVPMVEAQLGILPAPERTEPNGHVLSSFQLADHLDQADFEVFPYELNDAQSLGLLSKIFARQQATEQAGKPLVLFAINDECLAPHLHRPNMITFANLGYRSLRSQNEFCAPWFIDDPLPVYLNDQLPLRKKSDKPVIGFCGRAAISPSRLGWQLFRNGIRSVKAWTRLSPFAPPRVASEVAFRARILKSLQKSDLVETNFILRTKFLAGISRSPVEREDPFHPVRLEFFNNMLDSDYVICLRGAGNWSIRLYEALSCGRIPVYVDTDSILPFDFEVDWKKHVIWIQEDEIPRMDEIVADFHASISEEAFVEMQQAGRRLWLDRLSFSGFFQNFHRHLDHFAASLNGNSQRVPN